MEDKTPTTNTIQVYAGDSNSGNRVYEEIPATPLGDGEYIVLASPGLVLGLAKGDEISFNEDTGEHHLLKRGNNLCIQLYITPRMRSEVDLLEAEVAKRLNGTMDGRTDKQAVFSIHITKGFDAIEDIFNAFVNTNEGAEWYYGNVYDASDGVTPLNWWLKNPEITD